jgi:tetratricopeptide (TPR) repeat protein
MYQKIIEDIKRNLGENKQLNRRYLISQIEIYKTHEYSTEIIKEISRMIWECLSPEEQEEFVRIIEEENPIKEILIEAEFYIQNNDYETALEKLDSFMKTQPPLYENDEINEYHSFSNPLEELIFNEFIGCEKELRYISDEEPLEDLHYVYGFLLRDASRLDEAEKSLKRALELNPVSTKTILELCDIYKMRAPTFNKFYFYNMDALKYAYSGFELARIYKNFGFYYYEENNIELSIACYKHSLKFENDPFTRERVDQLESKHNITLNEEEYCELMSHKHIKLGANPFIIENLEKLAVEYENDNLLDQSLFFYRLLYSVKKENRIFDKIKQLDLKTRKQKKNLIYNNI